jgi:hypothetical protein
MESFQHFHQAVQRQKAMTGTVVDEFLIYYAAQKDKLDREADLRTQPFRHIVRNLAPDWPGRFKAQYIAHRIFKNDGLINKYIRHAALKSLGQSQREFLEQQMRQPWQYSFSMITDNPAKHVYKMVDVFRDSEFYLYSPGVTATLQDQTVYMWFNLIGFNGECWETFGPINGYKTFDEDDIFFFATELNSRIQSEEDLLNDVERNPTPYAMLSSGSQLPAIMKEQCEMIHLAGWLDLENFGTDRLDDGFETAYNEGVYKLTLRQWGDFPHYAVAYYDEEEKALMLTALTDKGYDALSEKLRACGLNTGEADIRVRPTMVKTASEILRRKIELNPYEEYFDGQGDPETEASLEKINRVLQLALPYINSNQQPDIDALAAQAGVDPTTVREAVEKSIAHMQEMRKRMGN